MTATDVLAPMTLMRAASPIYRRPAENGTHVTIGSQWPAEGSRDGLDSDGLACSEALNRSGLRSSEAAPRSARREAHKTVLDELFEDLLMTTTHPPGLDGGSA